MACKGRGRVFGRLTRSMKKYTVFHSVTAAPAAANSKVNKSGSLLKIGLDIHREKFVMVAQYEHATPRPPHRFGPAEFVLWVEARLREGCEVHVVYEACGFGYGLYRSLLKLGAHCYVIAPQKLDERNRRVKTDGRDARLLCLRLDRYLAGNQDSLAVIRVPSEEEERARHWGRQREQLVHHRQKLEAQGRDLLISHELFVPARWWRRQSWNRLDKLLPAWILAHLELYRPVLLSLDQQIRALTVELEKAAPAALPKGMGALSSVVISREICDWERFKNRRQVSSYTGLCPGEYSSGSKRVPGSITRHGNGRLRAALVELAWRMVRYQPQYHAVQKRLATLARGAQATRAARKKAIVAVARQLAVDLWRLHTGRCTGTILGFK
jgi:transposase